MKKFHMLLLVFTAIIGVCFIIVKNQLAEDKIEKNNTKNEEVIEPKKKSKIELIEEKTYEVFDGYIDNVSIYFKDLNTNEEYALNEGIYYLAASTTKVPLAMMILDEVNNGEKSLDQLLYFIENDREGGSGVLYYLEQIPSITIDEAINFSIVYSDNIARNMLSRVANTSSTEYMRNVANDNNIPYGNYTTAKQLGILLEKLYKNTDNNIYYNSLIEYMSNTIYHDRLDKYLDYDKVAHKIGNYYRYYHDMGIIYGKDTYILVVLTKDVGELNIEPLGNEEDDEIYLLDEGEKARELIATLSKEIYNIVEDSKM